MADPIQAFTKPAARAPNGLARVNGQALAGWESWEVNNNTFYEADTFRVTFIASRLPKERNVAWWFSQTEVFVELFGGFPPDPINFDASDLQRWIYGRTDHIDFDPVAGVLNVSGRDLTGYFIDTKTTEEWTNQTSSQIATALAQRHNLKPVVKTTTKKVGGYYKMDHVLITNQHSEWDLLSYLATNEEFVVYVKGQELHFEPRPDRSQAVRYVLNWQAPTGDRAYPVFNGKSLQFAHDLTLAKGVVVWVQAMNAKTGKPMTVAYPQNKAKGTKPGQASPHAQVYTVRMRQKPMTPEQALQKAQEEHMRITQHEMKLHAMLPGDNDLTPENVIEVRGTGTPLDQTYYPDSITRYMSASDGYSMEVNAKNIAKMNEGVL